MRRMTFLAMRLALASIFLLALVASASAQQPPQFAPPLVPPPIPETKPDTDTPVPSQSADIINKLYARTDAYMAEQYRIRGEREQLKRSLTTGESK